MKTFITDPFAVYTDGKSRWTVGEVFDENASTGVPLQRIQVPATENQEEDDGESDRLIDAALAGAGWRRVGPLVWDEGFATLKAPVETATVSYAVITDDTVSMDANRWCHATILDADGDEVATIDWDVSDAYSRLPDTDLAGGVGNEEFSRSRFDALATRAFALAGWHIPTPVPDAPWSFPTWRS